MRRFLECSIENCEKNAHRDANGKRGWCSMHYTRWRAHGDPAIRLDNQKPALDWIYQHAAHAGDECLIWPFARQPNGYGVVHRPDGRLTTVSRFMCETAHGPRPSDIHEAAHSCGNGSLGCGNPKHLRWDTPEGNHADKVEHGTTNRGERQWQARLTEADVRDIRAMLGTTKQKDIASLYGLNPCVISEIKTGRKWGWLTD